jgi:hypothetical protein
VPGRDTGHHARGLAAQCRLGIDARKPAGCGEFEEAPARGRFVEPARQTLNRRGVVGIPGVKLVFLDLLEDVVRKEKRGELRRETLEDGCGLRLVAGLFLGGLDALWPWTARGPEIPPPTCSSARR